MKKKHLFLTVFLIAAVQISFAQEALLSASISRDSIMIGEQVKWLFKIDISENDLAAFAQFQEQKIGSIEIVQQLPVDTLSQKAGRKTLQTGFLITSFDSGLYSLPEVPVQITRQGKIDTLYFDSVTLKVNTVSIDTTTFTPFDIKPPIKYPYTFKEIVWPWGVMALAAALLVGFIAYIILRLMKKKPVFAKEKPKEPAHITALRELERIKAEKLWQNNRVKLYYTRVTDVLRVYLEERYAIQAPEQTTDEILQALAQLPLPEQFLPRLHEFLSLSDLVKFAKYIPATEENEKIITLVETFISETKEQTENGKQEGNVVPV